MDEILDDGSETVGVRLRKAREAQNLSLETVAAQTRIPVRHLASLEEGNWENLPAPAYCVGFAKNYAAVVGLDRAQIADELRAEMGGTRQSFQQAEVFEPADPKRTMPKWLIIGAIAALALLFGVLNWMRQRSLEPAAPASPATVETSAPDSTAASPARTAAPVAATGPVAIVALQDAWIKVREKGGATLREGLLKQGETYAVPTTATTPVLDTGRPEALRIGVGGHDAPAIGPPGHSVAGVSLLAADLERGYVAPSTTTSNVPPGGPPTMYAPR